MNNKKPEWEQYRTLDVENIVFRTSKLIKEKWEKDGKNKREWDRDNEGGGEKEVRRKRRRREKRNHVGN